MNVLGGHINKWWLEPLLVGLGTVVVILVSLLTGGFLGPLFIGGIGIVVLAAGLFLRFPWLMVLGFLASTSIFLENEPGITPFELFFLAYNVAIIGIFIIPDFLRGNLMLSNRIDQLSLLFLLLVPYAIVLGKLNGAETSNIFSDATYFLGFATFFAFRRFMTNKNFRRGLLVIFIGLIFFVAIRNALNYQQILLEAYAEWQAEKARVSKNEVIILAGSSLFMVFTVYSRRWWTFLASLVGLGISLGSIIITQSRGYWIALVFSYLGILFFANQTTRRRILAIGLSLVALGITIAVVFFGDLLQIALKGLAMRLESLSTLGTGQIDSSLKERIWEYTDIFSFITQNPIAGYGFGTTYERLVVSANFYFHNITSYMHNGYLAIWFKFGILGLAAVLSLCFYLLVYAYKLYHSEAPALIRMIALTILGTLVGMLIVNNTSPQFLAYDSLLLFMLIATFLSYYGNIYCKEPTSNSQEA